MEDALTSGSRLKQEALEASEKDKAKSYLVIKQTQGFASLCRVRDEKRGKRVVQVYEAFIANLGRIDEAIAKELGIPVPQPSPKDTVKRPGWNILRPDVYTRDKGICWICHEFVPLDQYELGHIIDRGNGGYIDYDNLTVMHKDCNHHKPRHKTLNEHIMWLLKDKYLADKASHKLTLATPTQG